MQKRKSILVVCLRVTSGLKLTSLRTLSTIGPRDIEMDGWRLQAVEIGVLTRTRFKHDGGNARWVEMSKRLQVETRILAGSCQAGNDRPGKRNEAAFAGDSH